MNHQIAIHPTVSHTIARVLSAHGFPKDEIELAIAEVTARAIEAVEGRRRGPKCIDEWQIHCAHTARDYAVEHGKTPTRVEIDLEDDYPVEDGESDPEQLLLWCLFGDPRAQTKSQIAVLVEMLDRGEMPAMSREILASLGDGRTAEQTAQALGLTTDEVRTRLRQVRTRFFHRLSKLGLLVAEFDEVAIAAMNADDSDVETEKR